MNPLFQAMPVSIFEQMSRAAATHGAVNLGQGFPDFGWPEELLAEASRLVTTGNNQYAPSRGLPALHEAICRYYAHRQGLALTPDQLVITSGAIEAIAAILFACLQPGDEAVIIAPAYDGYAPLLRRAGAGVREVALRPPEWRLTREALEAAITPGSRILIVNNPHNPTGRLLDADEMAAVVGAARARDLLILADEVWEEVLAPGADFRSLLAEAPERTIKVGSAGKLFALTGWRIGWLVAPPALATIAAKAHQYLTFAVPAHLQGAVAVGLSHPEWMHPMRAGVERARSRLANGLAGAGYQLLPSEATWFQCIDLPASGIAMDDRQFARMAVEQAGIAVIPLSPFFEREPERGLVRLCHAKHDGTLDAGIAALARAREIGRRR